MTLIRVPVTILLAGLMLAAVSLLAGVPGAAVLQFVSVGGICATASIGGCLAIGLSKPNVDRLPAVLLLSVVIRGGLTALGLILLIRLGDHGNTATAVALGLWYGTYLLSDLVTISRHLAAQYPPPATDHANGYRT